MSRTPLTFHQVCATYGITMRALRHYEALEIVTSRCEGSTRIYDARQQVRLELLLKARRFRIRLEQARQIIELYDEKGPEAQARRWYRTVAQQRCVIRDEVARLQEVDREMARIVDGERVF